MQRRKIKLTICYDGTDYHGWQVQPGLKTVQETLCLAATSLIGRKTHVHGASRTDAGVHALGQSGLIEILSPIPTENFPRALSDRLPSDIAVIDSCQVDRQFNLIGGVKRKQYRYTICITKPRPVLNIRFCWHEPGKINVQDMCQASKYLIGKQDFKSMASAADHRKSSVRTIFQCQISEQFDNLNHWIFIDIEGDGFLYNMVRNIAGTLVDIGHGRFKPEQMQDILAAKDRQAAGQLAPASGLCLQWIRY